jgi:hypothetical protein
VTIRRIRLGATAAALLIAAGLAIASPIAARHATACTTSEGQILAYVPTAGHSCTGTVIVGLTVFRTETVRSGNPGQLTFQTQHLNRCIEFRDTKGSADVLYPSFDIAIRHLRGKTWCRKRPGDAGKTLLAPGAVIHISGTVFGIDSTDQQSLIRVTVGSVTATSTATGQRVRIPAGFQALFPTAGPPEKPRRLSLDADDKQGSFFLSYDVLPIGRAQAAEYLKNHHESAAVIVGEDAKAGKLQAAALPRIRTRVVTAAQAAANPKLVIARARQIRAHTIIAAGTFAALEATLKALATTAPPDITILYVAPSN